jgi:hypothetical protein
LILLWPLKIAVPGRNSETWSSCVTLMHPANAPVLARTGLSTLGSYTVFTTNVPEPALTVAAAAVVAGARSAAALTMERAMTDRYMLFS